MKENKKAILEILKKKGSKKEGKKDDKFETLVLNLALQKIDSDDFDYDGEAVYTTDKKRLVYCMTQETSFTIPEGVEIIGEMAFRGKKQLTHVIIPSTVKEIEHDAFYDCDELDNVYVPASVKTVKAYAFAECDKLKRVTFAGAPNKLSRHTFDDCDQLHDIIVPAGTSKFFRKELHYIDGDTDYSVLENPAKKEISADVKKKVAPVAKASKEAPVEAKTSKEAPVEVHAKKEIHTETNAQKEVASHNKNVAPAKEEGKKEAKKVSKNKK